MRIPIFYKLPFQILVHFSHRNPSVTSYAPGQVGLQKYCLTTILGELVMHVSSNYLRWNRIAVSFMFDTDCKINTFFFQISKYLYLFLLEQLFISQFLYPMKLG